MGLIGHRTLGQAAWFALGFWAITAVQGFFALGVLQQGAINHDKIRKVRRQDSSYKPYKSWPPDKFIS
jgi:hypothetical protein